MLLDLLKALADENRLRLVAVLARGEFTVQELTAILASGQSRISHHLKVLADAGLVAVKRQGTWAYYRLAPGDELAAQLLAPLAGRYAEVTGHPDDLLRLARILEERRQASRDFFDRHARQWDDMAATLLPTVPSRDQLLAALPATTELIVEVGIGTGGLLAALSGRCARLIGVDHSPAMLEQARQRVEVEGLGNVELRLGEMAHLPLGDASVSILILNMVLHHAPDPAAVFYELRRVMAAGGLLLVTDLLRHDEEWVRGELADQWLGFDAEELRNWLAGTGFRLLAYDELRGRPPLRGAFLLQAQAA